MKNINKYIYNIFIIVSSIICILYLGVVYNFIYDNYSQSDHLFTTTPTQYFDHA